MFFTGHIEQFIGLSERGGYRLFDEQIETGLKQHGRHRVVMHGGNGNRRRVEAEIRREQFFNRGEYGDGVVGFRVGGACAVRLDCSDQSNALAGGLKFAVDTKVVAAKCAGADDGNAYIAFACDCYAPLPSTAFRQRE